MQNGDHFDRRFLFRTAEDLETAGRTMTAVLTNPSSSQRGSHHSRATDVAVGVGMRRLVDHDREQSLVRRHLQMEQDEPHGGGATGRHSMPSTVAPRLGSARLGCQGIRRHWRKTDIGAYLVDA